MTYAPGSRRRAVVALSAALLAAAGASSCSKTETPKKAEAASAVGTPSKDMCAT